MTQAAGGPDIHKPLGVRPALERTIPRATLATALVLVTLLSGCTGDGTPFNPLDGGSPPTRSDEFRVPGLRVGDVYTYGFGFRAEGDPPFELAGTFQLHILEAVEHIDGLGRPRDALHVTSGPADGSFLEHYWVDVATLKQFKLERPDGYANTNHLTAGPAPGEPPVKSTSYGNATGTLQRHLEDPLFEDFNFFGPFATGRAVPLGQEFVIDGNLWMREDTVLLRGGNWSGAVEAARSESWGDGRRLTFEAKVEDGDFRQSSTWTGVVSAQVPLATEMSRVIAADFGDFELQVAYNATLQSFEPGTGEEILPQAASDAGPPLRRGDFAAWDRAPAEGSGAKLPFPLTEALAALDLDLTANQFFTGHPGSYLRFGVMEETNTCGAYPAPPPGCHWYSWVGVFDAPDDARLIFLVEKYADDAGGGPAFVPPVSREYPFDVVFDFIGGQPPEPPEAPVVVVTAAEDLPERSAFPPESLSTGGALALWSETATSANRGLTPNLYFFFLEPAGYQHFVSHDDWVFPERSLLFPLYDEGTMILERHTIALGPDGRVLESRNYDVTVTHK